jgi:hypothetical protein
MLKNDQLIIALFLTTFPEKSRAVVIDLLKKRRKNLQINYISYRLIK